MGLGDGAIRAVQGLWPPKDGEDPEPWRRNVFLMIIGIAAVLSYHLLAAGGWLSFLGVDDVASSGQVEIVKEQIKEVDEKTNSVLYAIYAPQIRAKVRERCLTEDGGERERINKEIDRIKKEYKDATGADFEPMPGCDEV